MDFLVGFVDSTDHKLSKKTKKKPPFFVKKNGKPKSIFNAPSSSISFQKCIYPWNVPNGHEN